MGDASEGRLGCRDRYYKHAVKHTFCHCCGCWLIILFLSALVNVIYPALYPGDGSQADIVDPLAIAKVNLDGRTYAQDLYLSEIETFTESSSVIFAYESKDGTPLFTPENLQLMCQMEEFVWKLATREPSCDVETEVEGICVTQKSESLLTGTSIVSLFYSYDETDAATNWVDYGFIGLDFVGPPLPFPGSVGFNASECSLLSETEVEYVASTIMNAIETSTTAQSIYGFFLDKETIENGFATAARTILSISVPIDGDLVVTDLSTLVQEDMFELLSMEPGFLRSVYRDTAQVGNLEVIFFEGNLISIEFSNLLNTDILMVTGSMVFVFFWMWIYTRSLIVTIPCVLAIFFSITVSMAVYKLVFQIEYFDFIHILAIFLILGIGADDLFVVFDAWHQSELHHKDEFERYKYTVNRATQSVFNTSFTTAIAFGVTGITPIVPISTFGIFAALTIIVCFVFTFTVFPSTVLLWHRYVERKEKRKMRRRKSYVSSVGSVGGKSEDGKEELGENEGEEEEEEEETAEAIEEEEQRRQKTKIDLNELKTNKNYILYKYYIPLMEKYDKWFVLLGFTIGILGAVGLSNFSPLTEPEEWLPEDHMLQVFLDSFGDRWLSGTDAEFVDIDIYWGVEDIERNIPGWYTGDPSRYGDTLVLNENFDLSEYEAQLTILNFCETLRSEECDFGACERSSSEDTTLVLSTSQTCTMEEFHVWWNETFSNTDYDIEDKTQEQKDAFFEALADFTEANSYSDLIGFSDGQLVYFATNWRLNANPLEPASATSPIENRIREILDEVNEAAPNTAKFARYACEEFVQNAVESALASTVLRGLSITFPIVFIVLLFATNNYILAVFACLSIAFIVIVVLGIVFSILEWELGIAESIVAIMIVGLSVDYTVHLGHMYTFAGTDEGFEKRDERFRFAILTMGPTVLAGATTTLGAGLFLFGAQILFFTKMGVLLTLTVLSSVYYSFFFMMPAASWIGPEGTYARFLRRGTKTSKLDEEKQVKINSI